MAPAQRLLEPHSLQPAAPHTSACHLPTFTAFSCLTAAWLQIVSFKWLARHHSISAAAAKQHLQAFAKQHSKSLTVTYLLSGFTQDEPPRHVVQLVNQGQLKERRAALDSETSFHVYSVQPAQIKVSHLAFLDHMHTFGCCSCRQWQLRAAQRALA